jgi:hypothetical protein
MPTVEDNAMLVLMKMLDEPQESARIYHSMTELRLQAESVPHLMEKYAGMPGYAGYLDHYPQILDVTKRLRMPTSTRRPRSSRASTMAAGLRCASRATCSVTTRPRAA